MINFWRIFCHLVWLVLLAPLSLWADQQPGATGQYHVSPWETEVLVALLMIGTFGGCLIWYRNIKNLNRRLQNALTQKEKTETEAKKFFHVVNGCPVSIIITNAQGFIEYANPMFCTETGYTSKEVIGRKPSMLQSTHTPLEVYEDLWQTTTRGEVWQGKLCCQRKDGTLFWAKSSIGPIKDQTGKISHYVAVKENIDQTVALEQELHSYQAKLEKIISQRTEELQRSLEQIEPAQRHIDCILASLADGLLVTDGNDTIILLNAVAEEFFKVQAKDVINTTTLQELLARHALSVIDLRKTETVKGAQRFDVELPTEDQQGIRVLQASSSRVYDKSGVELGGTVTLFHDITRERELDRLKTEFVSTAVHELRTPLTSIRGFSELLLERTFPQEEEKKFLFYINQQSENLTSIINDLLDVSRIESRQGLGLAKKETAIGPLLREVLLFCQEPGNGHHCNLHLDEQEIFLDIDKQKITQAQERQSP